MGEEQALEQSAEAAQVASDAAQTLAAADTSEIDVQGIVNAIGELQNSVTYLQDGMDSAIEQLYTLLVGLTSVQMFTLLAQLVLIGVCLALVFVVALRRL